MTTYLGIDGGGSTLRVVLVDESLNPIHQVTRGTANPSHIGREAAQSLIQQTISDVIADHPHPTAAAIGLAGASHTWASDWLTQVLTPVLPHTQLILSSDCEIALVGATGKREGLLILAGTGSVLYGISRQGEHLQIGGWGYLLGDEGSGYWLGLQALKMLSLAFDQNNLTDFVQSLCDHWQITSPRNLVESVYTADNPVPKIASLAPFVLQSAASGDLQAISIVEQAAFILARKAHLIIKRLDYADPQFAFTGGLLERDTILRRMILQQLKLDSAPVIQHSPVIGAALLAKIVSEATA